MKLVKVLTGVRRCGKSTILKMIMEKPQNERGISADQISVPENPVHPIRYSTIDNTSLDILLHSYS